jgi:hypothetical protein
MGPDRDTSGCAPIGRSSNSAVQELLRHVSFAQITKPRYARKDTELFGHPSFPYSSGR